MFTLVALGPVAFLAGVKADDAHPTLPPPELPDFVFLLLPHQQLLTMSASMCREPS
jgi:hypothetical protein